jgi:hypothetical protein
VPPADAITSDNADFLTRRWSADASARIADRAGTVCGDGPMRQTRHLMIAVLRSLHDLRDELDLRLGDHYLLPMPLLRPRTTPRAVAACNDLTIATLVVEPGMVDRPRELDAELARQLDAYTRQGLDEALWVTLTCAGWLPADLYARGLRQRRAFPRHSIGFASFRTDGWANGFCGCPLENFHACGLPPIPPGVMMTFTRFRERLNLGIAFFPHVCRPHHAEMLADRVEQHLLGRPRKTEADSSPVGETLRTV